MSELSDYLSKVRLIRGSGIASDERSYYPALDALFESVGATLMPKVVPIHDVANRGAGHPDYVLQVAGTLDTRASVEAKPANVPVAKTAHSSQVRQYLDFYGLCLVTNLRDFALVQKGKGGEVETIINFALTADDHTFWIASIESLSRAHSEGLTDFLRTVLTWDAVITRPKDLADALARYAREALRRLSGQPAERLDPLREALSKALGLHFRGDRGEHFFRSSLVQTLFYGLFSAWVVWRRGDPDADADEFRWREAGDYLSLPVMRELFEHIAIPTRLGDIRQTIEWAEATLRRTAWEPFAASFAQGDAVNYFYEPFLEAYDPELREQLGVWYTPREIIKYQVARVDRLLREELAIPTGLADERVIVLDPATGTGGYLLEVLRTIDSTLRDQSAGSLRAMDLMEAARSRVFGFEILPAPFVVAHLQIATLLGAAGAKPGPEHRAGVYLTNALTGWSVEEVKQLVLPEYPALKGEAEAAARVKQETKILVVLGNPPYRNQAGVAEDEERNLIAPYYEQLTERFDVQPQGLNDLYVRFLRLAERQIAETTGRGVVSFITNGSWLDGLSHPVMREHMINAFGHIWIDNLHGGGRFKGSRAPDGRPDRSIFEYVGGHGPVGITVPTAIVSMLKTGSGRAPAEILYRDLWGQGHEKRQRLAQDATATTAELRPIYQPVTPTEETEFALLPGSVNATYGSWPALDELFVQQFPGVKTSRDPDLVSMDRQLLSRRMQRYFDPQVTDEELARYAPVLMTDASRYYARATRQELLKTSAYREDRVVPYAYRPLDNRWLYWEGTTKLLDEKRSDYFEQVFPGNLSLEVIRHQRKAGPWDHGVVLGHLMDLNFVDGGGRCFPLYEVRPGSMFAERRPNFRDHILAQLTAAYGDSDDLAELVFFHIAAILNTPAYRRENAGAIRRNWARIPFSASRKAIELSASLGREVANLLRPEVPFAARQGQSVLAVPRRADAEQLTPQDLAVTARYSGLGKYEPETEGSTGHPSRLWWNERAYWENVPEQVWAFSIGGYPVIKKWLDYRHVDRLARPLTSKEIGYVTEMVRRIAALLDLGPALDDSYYAVKDHILMLAKTG